MFCKQMPASAESEKNKSSQLTESNGVVDPETAEHSVNVTGMSKSISSHDNLKGLWSKRDSRLLTRGEAE